MKVLMFALVSMVLCAGRAFATPLSPREFYLQAIETMAHLPEPAFVTYEFDAKDEGLTGTLQTDCLPCVHVGKGRNRWPVQYRSSDHATEVTDKDGTRYFPKTFGFDPTWAGVYRALHTGMINVVGTYRVPRLPLTPSPEPVASSSPGADLETIALVSAIGPGIYNIEDRGNAPCPDGKPGRALHLWSRTLNPRHELSDVIIDRSSMRFCMMRFALNGPGPLGGNAIWEVHFGDVGGYWVETGGIVVATQRIFGISSMHGTWRFTLSNMQFPETIPAANLTPPAGKGLSS